MATALKSWRWSSRMMARSPAISSGGKTTAPPPTDADGGTGTCSDCMELTPRCLSLLLSSLSGMTSNELSSGELLRVDGSLCPQVKLSASLYVWCDNLTSRWHELKVRCSTLIRGLPITLALSCRYRHLAGTRSGASGPINVQSADTRSRLSD